jgi:hypothetical protein
MSFNSKLNKYYHLNGTVMEFRFREFDKTFESVYGTKPNPEIHQHRLNGPLVEWNDGDLGFFINGELIASKRNKNDYWNHPEVKKYMLLKAIKELK